jgi:hypothetical protein
LASFAGSGREQYTPASVDPANNFAVKNMSPDDSKRACRKDLLLASAMVAVGLAVAGLSLAELKASNPQMAQATQPLQSTPGAETKPSVPSEPATTGARPTGIPPQPARPDAEAQKAGATSVLPPAPAEKIGTPIKER